MTKFLNISTDNTLGGNSPSDVTVSSQRAVKEYVDSHATGSPSWGSITGTLSNQTDLQNALNAKYDASNPNGYTSNVGTVTSVNNVSPVNGNVTLSIPTVNDATLTITQGGTTKGTFTANASSDVTIALDSGGGSVDVDNKSITTNSSDEIQTVGIINSRDSSTAIKTWTGTKAQYDAIVTKDANTLYNITDDTDISLIILEALYPVGSVYITTANTCPLSALISGSTWTQETYRQLVEKKEPTDNDPSWYNLYSDGWIEQGGVLSSSTEPQTINFPKSFTDTNYIFYHHCPTNGTAGVNYRVLFGYDNTINSIKVYTGKLPGTRWEACGYTSMTTSHKQFRRTA